MIYTAGMEVPVRKKRSAAQNRPVLDGATLREVETQLQEAEERIRARNPEATDEEVEQEVGEQIFECLAVQRRYLQQALRIAERIVQAQGYFPQHRDYATTVEMIYVGQAAMSLCSVTDPFGSPLANDVDGLAKRCNEAESGRDSDHKLIENLQDEIADLKHQISRKSGGTH